MGTPQIDWTFARAPDEPGPSNVGPPQTRGPSKPPRRPASRRLLVGLLGIVACLGLGAWLFTRVRLLRIQSQLAAEIAYEDQRALAGNVAAVLALQAPNATAWRDQLSAQVRLGLAAPLPAGDLLPAGTPPRLARVDPLGGDLFSATVTRDYVDSAGQTYAFDLAQRYRNLAPGQWERLPPDSALLSPTTIFQGRRLSATMPTIDLPWLRPALLQADALLVQSCADWADACQAGWRLPVTFGAAPELSNPAVTVRPASAAGSGYARIFDFSNATSGFPDGRDGYDLAAPLLAGRPHDAAAQAALSRSISVRVLGLFAGEVTGQARANNDYFLDALVARAEARHLDASAVAQPTAPQDYVPPAALWAATFQPRGSGSWRTDLPARREAFAFLNYVLAGQSASVDGALLRTLHHSLGPGVRDWLNSALGPRAQDRADQWTQSTLAAFAAHPLASWADYNGLVLACDDWVYQVQAGTAKQVTSRSSLPGVATSIGSVSPDGRYADYEYLTSIGANPAMTNSAPSPWTVLMVIDMSNGNYPRVIEAPVVTTIGWTATDELIYTANGTRLSDIPPRASVPLWAYHADTGTSEQLIPDRVWSDGGGPGVWSADHTRLLVGLAAPSADGRPQLSLAVLTFGPPVALQRLSEIGDAAALSPDGRQMAYVKFSGPAGTTAASDAGLNWLNVLDTLTGAVTTLAGTNDHCLPMGLTNFWGPAWSPDGRTLAWRAYHMNSGDYLLSAPAASGPVHVLVDAHQWQLFLAGFSADGRYLAAVTDQDMPPLDQYWLFDQQSPGVPPPLTGWTNSIVWTPNGYRLIMASAAGVSALDPSTGDYEWLGPWHNCQLRW